MRPKKSHPVYHHSKRNVSVSSKYCHLKFRNFHDQITSLDRLGWTADAQPLKTHVFWAAEGPGRGRELRPAL